SIFEKLTHPGYYLTNPSMLAHELGHTFGLYHANLLDCGENYIDEFQNCTPREYGDFLDAVGGPREGLPHYNAINKKIIGFINNDRITTVNTNGTYTINDVTNPTGPIALKILKNQNAKGEPEDYYWIELKTTKPPFEQYMKKYATPNTPQITMYKKYKTPQTERGSLIIDTNPTTNIATPQYYLEGLTPDFTFTDNNGIKIQTKQTNQNTATIKIEYC
ncbi:MAG: hypothetical protein QXX06_02955, partial [Candidatus Diapherotrites archaeon]